MSPAKTKPAKRTKGRAERRKTPSRPPSSKSINMVVAPVELRVPVPADYRGDYYVWDLDKTYLRTHFETLRDLVRTAMQKAKDKEAYPGAAPLLRALRRGPGGQVRPIYFVSASPPQIAQQILEKFALDGVEVDGVYFKDNMRNMRPGRFGRLREQMGYKLLALLHLRSRLPEGAVETMFGDDAETDFAIYSLYSEMLERRIAGFPLYELLAKQGVFRDEALRVAWGARQLPKREAVRRIYIMMHRQLDPRYYRRYGRGVTATRSHFQNALALCNEGRISLEDVAAVGEELLARGGKTRDELARELFDLKRRAVLSPSQAGAMEEKLGELKVIEVGVA